MSKISWSVLGVVVGVLLIGAATIVWSGRPVMQVENTNASTSPTAATYTMEQVVAHNSASDCWSAINGSVYDLSTWVGRHPGGVEAIVKLCGADGSEKFTKKHGAFAQAQDALILLKIGALK